jgi:hypothetical protein
MNKRILSVFLSLALLVSLLSGLAMSAGAAETSGKCGDNASWSFSNGTLTIIGSGEMKDFTDLYSAPWADLKEDIAKVIVQPGITRIGDFAFSGCHHLRSVSFPDSLCEFGGYAFSHTGLQSISIPKGVTQVSYGLFCECSSLEEVIFHDQVEYIGVSAFYGCSSLKRIDLPVKTDTVCDGAFKECVALEHVSMPSVFAIPAYCFEQCSSLSDVALCPNLEVICTWAFKGCKSLKSIKLPASTEWIRDGAFIDSGLSSIIIPWGTEFIDENAIGYSGDGKEFFTVYGYTGTTGEDYAKKNDIRFVALDGTVEAFLDVPETAYYRDAVCWAVEKKVTNGVRPDAFSPDNTCTRAQVVTFLWRSLGSPLPASVECPFTDVPQDAYYRQAVLWAMDNGITTGTSATTFSPDKPCTRAQVVTFQWRAHGKTDAAQASNPFGDVSADAYYYDAVLWAVKMGVTTGTSATTFSPDKPCTRGQIVTFLYRDYYPL